MLSRPISITPYYFLRDSTLETPYIWKVITHPGLHVVPNVERQFQVCEILGNITGIREVISTINNSHYEQQSALKKSWHCEKQKK
jgi:hypothetical protein